jgi:hypothetical protein
MQEVFGELLNDMRIGFSDGSAHISAEIQTDHGVVTLG